MRGFADTAGMRRRNGGCKRQWDESSREREQEQESGGQAMHVFQSWNPANDGPSMKDRRVEDTEASWPGLAPAIAAHPSEESYFINA